MTASDKIFFAFVSFFVFVAIASAWYHFMIKKDYQFMVEASCDPTESICYYRDCSTGECPPNELEYYHVYLVGATDFEYCSDESCGNECRDGLIMCEEVACDPEVGDDCTVIEDYATIMDLSEVEDEYWPENPIGTTTVTEDESADIPQDATSTLETTI